MVLKTKHKPRDFILFFRQNKLIGRMDVIDLRDDNKINVRINYAQLDVQHKPFELVTLNEGESYSPIRDLKITFDYMSGHNRTEARFCYDASRDIVILRDRVMGKRVKPN